jgi:rubrerythrin
MTSGILSVPSRRGLIIGSGRTLTAASIAVLAGTGLTVVGARPANAKQDAEILNAAIALEHEGIAAYQIAAESGLLQPEVVQVGVTFQGHHKLHRDELIKAVTALGATPAEPKKLEEYAADLKASELKDQAGVLRLALGLERGAANAYLSLIPSLGVDFHQVAGRMAGDEAFHVAILANALGEPIPKEGLMFGG